MRVLAVTLTGILITAELSHVAWWRNLTATVYASFQRLKQHRHETPNETVLVLIGDDDYRRGNIGRVRLTAANSPR